MSIKRDVLNQSKHNIGDMVKLNKSVGGIFLEGKIVNINLFREYPYAIDLTNYTHNDVVFVSDEDIECKIN